MFPKKIEEIVKDIKWNFTKFVVVREGKVVARYSPTFNPEDMEDKIKEIL